MEKLIKLLNEYTRHSYVKFEDGMFEEKYCGEPGDSESQVYVISKEFGFIERLVENDKIDISKAYEKIGKPQIIMYDERNKEDELCEIIGVNERDYHDDIIMLLSIQDEPIEFLISVLK